MDRAGAEVAGPQYEPGRGREPEGHLTGALLVLAAAVLWGAMGLFAKAAYRHGVAPLDAVSTRGTIAFLGLLPAVLLRPALFRMRIRDLPFFAAYGAVGIAAFYAVYFLALDHLPISVAAALLYTAPAFAVVLAYFLFRERLDGRKAVSLATVLVGVALVTGAVGPTGGGVGPGEGAAAVSGTGILLGLAAGLTYALYTLFGKRATRGYGPLPTVLYATGFGALFLALAAPPWRAPLEHPEAIPALLGLALISTLAANLLYISGLARLEAGVASLLATIEPVVAALLGVLLLEEALAGSQAVGIGLVVAGALVLTRSLRRSAPPPPAPTPR